MVALLWADYLSHFKMCAVINKWTEPEKGAFLAISLRGRVQQVLASLPIPERNVYSSLVKELKIRYCHYGQEEWFRMQLKSRARRPKETLPQLGKDVK